MAQVIHACTAPYLLVSFNEGYLHRTEIEMLRKKGAAETFSVDHPRYVGAKIGISISRRTSRAVSHTEQGAAVVAPEAKLLEPVVKPGQ